MYLTLVSPERMVFTVNSGDVSIQPGDKFLLGCHWFQLGVTVSETDFIDRVLHVTFKGDGATVLDDREVREVSLRDYFPDKDSKVEVLEVLYSV